MKGTKLGVVAVDAIVHMIGQTEDLFSRGATLAEIAVWLNVSKPTARRFLQGEACQNIDVEMVDWRKGHSVQYRYRLSAYTSSAYKRDVFKASYHAYVGAMYGVRVKS